MILRRSAIQKSGSPNRDCRLLLAGWLPLPLVVTTIIIFYISTLATAEGDEILSRYQE